MRRNSLGLLISSLLMASFAGAQEEPSLKIHAYSFKAFRGPSETGVEFGARIVARAPLAFGDYAPFTVAADELTVSLKMRRNVIFAKYQAELDALYRE